MAMKFHHLAGPAEAEDGGGLLSRLLADEERLDRQGLWRLGSWGVGAVAAVIGAMLASQSSMALRRDERAADDLVRQAQQIQQLARDNQLEARRLAAAIETLNGDRDRLYSRVTSLEQGLDSVTGSITRQSVNPQGATIQAKPDPAAPARAASPDLVTPTAASAVSDKPAQEARAPLDAKATQDNKAMQDAKTLQKAPQDVKAPDSSPATTASLSATARPLAASPPLVMTKSIMAPPDPVAGKLIEAAPPSPSDKPPAPTSAAAAALEPVAGNKVDPQAAASIASSETPAAKTDFAIDLGGANSFAGLRGLWRGLLKANPALGSLRPMVVVRESNNGLGMQLRLLAGPIINAAAAARLCAALVDGQRTCETATFEGQHLSLAGEDKAGEKVTPAKPASRRHTGARRASQAISNEPSRQTDAPKKPEQSKLSSFFSRQ